MGGMKHSKKKKKRARAPHQANVKLNVNGDGGVGGKDDEDRVLPCLAEAFSSASLDEVPLAYWDAGGDANKAAEILGGLSESASDPSTGWSSSERCFDFSGDDPPTSSTSSERFSEADVIQLPVRAKGFGGSKQRKFVASAGTVSGVIGKDYMRTKPYCHGEKCDSSTSKGVHEEPANNGEVEQFVWSMLGDECELSMEVVRDVLGHCGYNVEKALDALLDLSLPFHNQFKDGDWSNYNKNDDNNSRTFIGHTNRVDDTRGKSQLAGRMSDSIFQLSEQELQQILHSSSHGCSTAIVEPGLPQKVLESLFNIPKSSEHESDSMNWKNIVMKMESFGQGLGFHPPVAAKLQLNTNWGKDEEYRTIRKVATQRYDAVKSSYQKAATAYSRGERGYAAYLSEQGRIFNKTAKEADEKASQEIFQARNKGIQNTVTIDLHGQHVKEAIRLLKVHLLIFSTYIPSVQILRVITGCGTHGVGMGKLKQSVIGLVKKEGIKWSEENQGTVLIKLDGRRDFSFVESEDESE